MGACSGKLSGAKHGSEDKLSKQNVPEAGNQALLQSTTKQGMDAVSQASRRESPPQGKHDLLQRVSQPQDKAGSMQCESSRQKVKVEARRELRKSADFWSKEGRLQSFSNEELVDLYKRDNTLLLDSVQRIQETVRARQDSSAAIAATRGQDDLQEGAKAPVDNGNSTSASSDGLSPSTPRGVLDVRFSSRSEEVSSWPAEPPGSAAYAELGGDIVRWLLERDPPGEDIAADYNAGRMLGAYNKLDAWCKRHEIEYSSLEPYSKLLGIDVAALREHYRMIQEMLEYLTDEEEKSYAVARDDGDLRLLYKQIKGTSVHCIRMDAVLSCPLEHALALAREFDLVSDWNSYVTDSLLLAAPTIWQSWIYGSTWMPFPIPQMDAVAQGRGYDLSEEDRSLLVMMRSVEEAELPEGCQPLPKKANKRKRVTILDGSSLRFEALPPDEDGKPRTKGTIMARIDPHLPHVPAFLVTFVLSVLAPFAHRMIKELLRKDFADPDKPFPRRMAAQPELYDRVREVVAEGLAKHYGIGARADRASS